MTMWWTSEERTGAVPGQMTVFVSLIMMCLFAVFCVLVESARTAGARWYLQMAADSAMDSIFSQYHRELWDSYRLLFAEYENEEDVEADFAGFLQPYLEVDNWYPMECQAAEVEELMRVTDDGGRYLEQEILDYMKYGIWDMDFEVETDELLWDYGREAEAVKQIASVYRGHAKEALKLEHALEDISQNLAEQEESRKQGLARLRAYDGSGFCRSADAWIRNLKKVPGLVATYRRRADELARTLEQSRNSCQTQRDACSNQVNELLEEEIREYEAYVSLDGTRRQEIEQLESWSERQIVQVEALKEEAREVERILDEWDDDENDPDLSALWGPLLHRLEQVEIRQLSFWHGVKDQEKENWLKQVEKLYQDGLLAVLVPDGVEISNRHADLVEVPSHADISSHAGTASGAEQPMNRSRNIAPAEHLLVNEYCGAFFRCFGDGVGDEGEGCEETVGKRCGKGGENHVLDYEMEYLIGGAAADEENLTSAVHRLLAIREGLNLIHILSDSAKRAEARSMALTVTGLAAATPLTLVVSFFIMSVWALGEAMMDVRGLLAGKRVPVRKEAEDWALSLDGLLTMGSSRTVETGGGTRGLGYLSWMKILLFLDGIVEQEYRMMDIMQMNLRVGQDGFRMRRGVYQLRITGNICGKHVFYSPWFVENMIGEREHRYPMTVHAQRVY